MRSDPRCLRRHPTRAVLAAALVVLVLPSRALGVPSSPRESDPRAVTVLSQPFHVLSPVEARFVLRLPVDLDPAATIEFRLHRRVATRDSFRAIADGFADPAVIDVARVPLSRAERSPDGTVSVGVRINTSQTVPNDLRPALPGIYPVSILVTEKSAVVAGTQTFINRREPGAVGDPTPVSTVAVLAAAVTHDPQGMATVDDEARNAVARFVTHLESSRQPMTLQIQPELLDTLSLSPEAPDQTLLERMRAALVAHSVIVAPYAPVDPVALVHSGLSAELTEQMRLGEATLNRLLPGITIERSTWLARETLDSATLTFLGKLGISSLVLMPGALEGTAVLPGQLSRAQRTDPPISVMAVDAQAATTVDAAVNDAVRASARLAAELIAERDDLMAAGVAPGEIRLILSSTTGEIVDEGVLAATAGLLAGAPGLRPDDLGSDQTVDERHPVVSFPRALGRSMGGLASAVTQARSELDAIGSMLAPDDPRTKDWAATLAIASSTAVGNGPEYVADLKSALRQLTARVSLVTPAEITLPSRNGSIRLQLRNDDASPLRVRIVVTSPKVSFPSSRRVVNLLPGGTTEVIVPARARSNGTFPVTVRVMSPLGRVHVASPTVITARVSEVAGLGQVISLTLLLMVLAWWFASWRRTARARAAGGTVGGA